MPNPANDKPFEIFGILRKDDGVWLHYRRGQTKVLVRRRATQATATTRAALAKHEA